MPVFRGGGKGGGVREWRRRVSRTGTPKTSGYSVLHEGPLGIFNNKKSEVAFASMHKEDARNQEFESTGGWVGITDKYWLAAVIAPNDMHFKARFVYTNPDGVDVYQTDYLGVDGVTVAPGGAEISRSMRVMVSPSQ